MSIELLLIPLGIAAAAAWREHHRTDLCEGCRTTRIEDRAILLDGLAARGITDVAYDDQQVRATSEWGVLHFQRVGPVYLGRVDGAGEEVTLEMLTALETSVGELLQARNVERIRDRAAALGLRLVLEQADDNGTVQLVFEEAS